MLTKKKDVDGVTNFLVIAFGFQVLIFIVINALSGAGLLNGGLGAGLRAVLHIVPSVIILVVGLFYGVGSFALTEKGWAIGLAVGMLAFSIVLVSSIFNGVKVDYFFKVLVFFVHFANVIFLIPLSLSAGNYREFLRKFSLFYCLSVAMLSAVVFYLYFSGGSPYSRVGYPFIPGVYSYMCVVAFGLSVFVQRSWGLSLFFGLSIFLSGSRVGLFLAVLIAGLFFFSSFNWKKVVFSIFIVFMVFLAWGWMDSYSRPYTVERVDVTSGRLGIWTTALGMISESPVIGYAKEITFGKNEHGEGLVAHNSFIDLSLSHGLFFAFLVYIFWAWLSFTAWRRREKFYDRALIFILFFTVFSKSLVANVFWTNMGDGVTYSALILLCAVVYSKRDRDGVS